MKTESAYRTPSVCLLASLLFFSGAAVADTVSSAKLNVTANITEGTCDVRLATSDNGAAQLDNSVSVGTVEPSNLIKGGVAGAGWVKVSLTACSGVNASATAVPSVKVVGNVGAIGASGDGLYLFKPSVSTADSRVGVVLTNTALPSNGGVAAWNVEDYIKNDSYISLGTAGQNGGQVTAVKQVYLGLSCGSQATCSAGGAGAIQSAGELTAYLSFTFAYH